MGELYRSSVSVCIRWREYTAYMHVLHSWTRQATGVSHKCLFLQVSTVGVGVWGGGGRRWGPISQATSLSVVLL